MMGCLIMTFAYKFRPASFEGPLVNMATVAESVNPDESVGERSPMQTPATNAPHSDAAERAARRQESPTPVDDDNPMGAGMKKLELGRSLTTNWRCG